PALQRALDLGSVVIPVFILDPHLLDQPAPQRQAFLFAGLYALDAGLRVRGSRLVLRQGQPEVELARLMAETGASCIIAEEDYTPYARTRDAAVAARLPLELVLGVTVFHPAHVVKANGQPYRVFTPFSRAWKALPFPGAPAPAPAALPPIPADLISLPIPAARPSSNPSTSPSAIFPAGEAEAHRRLADFAAGPLSDYADARNRLDLDGTSTLSPYLHLGMLSARQAAHAALAAWQSAAPGAEVWLNELIWREFYHTILYHYPQVLKTALNPELRRIPWRNAPADLRAWQQGLTGYPVVDAAMRQLTTLGWMHNRARMIVASFLVKDLLINWQSGERWFMQALVDGDPAANNGGWQWVAGVGADAAPYFRIFNPVLQSEKFDPAGRFIRHWVPELAAVPDGYIHAPWLMPPDVQRSCGVQIGRHYPAPMVDHTRARERTLAAYRASAIETVTMTVTAPTSAS
ncbi:MAG TPA: deoxyribodipyrimidine photo-lyase, partial [Anaerolineaceae bacterium]|nr:deoxyribodipyrimidine photo-lyase [Anaerolineaceae bacterium]